MRTTTKVKHRKRCPSCGAFNAETASMCEMCGFPLTAVESAPASKPAARTTSPVASEMPPRVESAPRPTLSPTLGKVPRAVPSNRKRGLRLWLILAVVGALVLSVGALVLSGMLPLDWLGGVQPPQPPLPLETAPAEGEQAASAEPTAQPTETPLPMPTAAPSPTPAPTLTTEEATTAPETPTPLPTVTSVARQTYTVQPGDNCSTIAQRFGVRLRDLLAWNDLTPERCTSLRVGQELFVSPP